MTRSRQPKSAPAPIDLATAPLPFLLHQADELGAGFRLHGRAVAVLGAGLIPPDLSSTLHARCAEIWDHIGGTAFDTPPRELLASLGIGIVIPQTVAEAEAALAQIEADSDLHTPEDCRDRPGFVGLDIETAALDGEEVRPPVKLKKDGYLYAARSQPAADGDSGAGLSPDRSHIRLVQLYAGGDRVVILDTNLVPLEVLRPLLQRRTLVIHNAGFELLFLMAAGFEVPHFECTMQGSGLLIGVYRRGLDDTVKKYFDIELPKGLQRSDWSSPYLTEGQYCYAALDAIFAFRLWLLVRAELHEKGRGWAYLRQRDVLPAAARLTAHGIFVDRDVHAAQDKTWKAGHAEAKKNFLIAEIRRRADNNEPFALALRQLLDTMDDVDIALALADTDSNIEEGAESGGEEGAETRTPTLADARRLFPDTPDRIRAYLREVLPPTQIASWPLTPKKGELSVRNSDLRRVAHLAPIRALLAVTALEKLIGVFGADLIKKVSARTGRLHPGYIVSGTKTARASSRGPNIQQIPGKRAPEFRRCFAAPSGRVLIAADYKAMELRAAAAISGDPVMNADFANGIDLHQQTAAAMLGIAYDAVGKEDRDRAKAINFGIIYGSGAVGLAGSAWNNFGIEISVEEAEQARQAFLGRYATYKRWMDLNHALAAQNGVLPIGSLGRVIEAAWETKSTGNGAAHHWHPESAEDAEDFDSDEYWNQDEDDGDHFGADNNYGQLQGALRYTLCCNAPIQGACADCSMLALLKVDAALREAGIDAFPVLWIHDEIVVEARKEDVERVRRILFDSMTEAFAETFPDAPLDGDVVETGIGDSWASAKP